MDFWIRTILAHLRCVLSQFHRKISQVLRFVILFVTFMSKFYILGVHSASGYTNNLTQFNFLWSIDVTRDLRDISFILIGFVLIFTNLTNLLIAVGTASLLYYIEVILVYSCISGTSKMSINYFTIIYYGFNVWITPL